MNLDFTGQIFSLMAPIILSLFLMKYMHNVKDRFIVDLVAANSLFVFIRSLLSYLMLEGLIEIHFYRLISGIFTLVISLYFCYWLHHNFGKRLKQENKISNGDY